MTDGEALGLALRSLERIRGHAERAPEQDPELIKLHGERACMVSSFAMIRMMAENALEAIGHHDEPLG
jgi:hypothetical protein